MDEQLRISTILLMPVERFRGGQHTYVVIRDFNRFDSSPTPRSLTINLKFGQLDVFEWNESNLDWEKVEE